MLVTCPRCGLDVEMHIHSVMAETGRTRDNLLVATLIGGHDCYPDDLITAFDEFASAASRVRSVRLPPLEDDQ